LALRVSATLKSIDYYVAMTFILNNNNNNNNVCEGKTTMTWLPNGKETSADMVRRFDRIPACNRQADEQTDGHIAADSLCYA